MIITDTFYDNLNMLVDSYDPRTKNWKMITPWFIFFISGSYLYLTYVGGPLFMKKRKPYSLDKIVQFYNILQVVLNGCLFYEGIILVFILKYKFICEPVDRSNDPDALKILQMTWFYYLLKIFDLLDTVFFILRKKWNQITYLHVFHHCGMIYLSCIGVKFVPGGHAVFIGLINTFVHVIMYSYYFLASIKYSQIWWKKYVTVLQILQFALIALQNTLATFKRDCEFSKFAVRTFVPFVIYLMLLFALFYYNSYIKNESSINNKNRVSNKANENM